MPFSAPHLDHLAVCAACREEVGLDPSWWRASARDQGPGRRPRRLAGAWLEIRRRALQPEPPPGAAAAPVFRLAPVGAAVVLALALLAPVGGFSPFRVDPLSTNLPLLIGTRKPPSTIPSTRTMEMVAGVRHRPAPSPPPPRALAATDPGIRPAHAAER